MHDQERIDPLARAAQHLNHFHRSKDLYLSPRLLYNRHRIQLAVIFGQVAERVMLTAQLLYMGAFKVQIHEAMRVRFAVCWRTADNYIARARGLLLSGAQKSRDQLVSEAYGFYSAAARP